MVDCGSGWTATFTTRSPQLLIAPEFTTKVRRRGLMNTGSCINKEKGGSGNCVFKFLLAQVSLYGPAYLPGKLDSLRAFVMPRMPRRAPGHNFSACVRAVQLCYLTESQLTFSQFLSLSLEDRKLYVISKLLCSVLNLLPCMRLHLYMYGCAFKHIKTQI